MIRFIISIIFFNSIMLLKAQVSDRARPLSENQISQQDGYGFYVVCDTIVSVNTKIIEPDSISDTYKVLKCVTRDYVYDTIYTLNDQLVFGFDDIEVLPEPITLFINDETPSVEVVDTMLFACIDETELVESESFFITNTSIESADALPDTVVSHINVDKASEVEVKKISENSSLDILSDLEEGRTVFGTVTSNRSIAFLDIITLSDVEEEVRNLITIDTSGYLALNTFDSLDYQTINFQENTSNSQNINIEEFVTVSFETILSHTTTSKLKNLALKLRKNKGLSCMVMFNSRISQVYKENTLESYVQKVFRDLISKHGIEKNRLMAYYSEDLRFSKEMIVIHIDKQID